MKHFKGDLILKEDIVFDKDIIVEGNIRRKEGKRYDLKVAGNIDAEDINARNILCEKISLKSKENRVFAYSLVTDRFSRERRKWKIKELKK